MEDNPKTILALYPNRHGVAYALFHNAQELVDYGIGYVQPISNKKIIQRVKKYIKYYKPDIIITRNVNDIGNRKSKRIQGLIDMICREAKLQNLEVHSYTRTQIGEVFNQFKATSKYQISKQLIKWFSALKVYEFPKRKKWMSENSKAGVFDAVSLGIVYYFLEL